MKAHYRRLSAAIVLVFCFAGRAVIPDGSGQECEWDEADVFVGKWDVLYSLEPSLADLKRSPAVRIAIGDKTLVRKFLQVTRNQSNAEPCAASECNDAGPRFFAEFRGPGECREVFAGNRTWIYNLTRRTKGRTDEAFKRRFVSFAE